MIFQVLMDKIVCSYSQEREEKTETCHCTYELTNYFLHLHFMYTNMHNFQIFESVWKIECKFYDLFLLVKWLAKNIRYSQREYLEDF